MIGIYPGILNLFWIMSPIMLPVMQKMNKNMKNCQGLNINVIGISTLTSAAPINCIDHENIKNRMKANFMARICQLIKMMASAAIERLILLLTWRHFRSV